jgi:hypothetical protein
LRICEQLISLTSKLSQAEASQQAAATRLGEAEERVADLKQQLVTSARERAATLLALAQIREQHEELQTEHSRQTELHRAAVAEHEARRARDDAQVEEMARIISHLQECARVDKEEMREREKRERLAAEKNEEKDETIEALARQSSEYRATVMQHEESLAELRAQCSKDAALVARLRVRVEQQEGLLVEQAAQLCQNEAHIAQLESELQQQQAWDNLGTPEKSGSERRLKGAIEGMSQGHMASGGSGGGLEGSGVGKGDGEAAAAVAAKRVALAECHVASLEQQVRDLKSDKDKLAGLLQVCVLCMYVYTYACTYVYTYIYILYTHTHTYAGGAEDDELPGQGSLRQSPPRSRLAEHASISAASSRHCRFYSCSRPGFSSRG